MRAQRVPDSGCNFTQHLVPRAMTEGVVDLFEMVDIGQEERKLFTGAVATAHLSLYHFHDPSAVEETSQEVVPGFLGNPLLGSDQLVLESKRPLRYQQPSLEFCGVKRLGDIVVDAG